ncbi:hypothetical protein BOS5A_231146 [Bosea sp. EC-HK365B]|nr:hypothetical protein BOS5A_231146 [Bosea sp. EC-HK365B]
MLDLVGRNVRRHLQLAGLEAAGGGGEVGRRIVDDRVDLDVRRVVEVLVLLQPDMRVRHELLQRVGAVRDPVLRLDKVLAEFLHGGRMDRQPGLVRQQFQEIGGGPLQRNLERALVDRLDAEVFELGAFACLVDLLGIEDGVEDVGVFRPGLRIDHAPEREDEIIRRDRVAIRPFGVGAQLEAVALAVGRHRPALGDTGHDLAVDMVDHQAFGEIAQEMGFADRRGLVRIERFGIAVIAAMEHDLRQGGAGKACERKKKAARQRERPDGAPESGLTVGRTHERSPNVSHGPLSRF